MKRKIRLTEAGLRRVISNSVKRILNEEDNANYVAPNDSTRVRPQNGTRQQKSTRAMPQMGTPQQKHALDLFKMVKQSIDRRFSIFGNLDPETIKNALSRFIKNERALAIAVAIATVKIGALPMNTAAAYNAVCAKVGFDLIKYERFMAEIAKRL